MGDKVKDIEKLNDVIKTIREQAKRKEEILKKCEREKIGLISIDLLLTDVDKDTFENWQVGGGIEGHGFASVSEYCTGSTIVVAINQLEGLIHEIRRDSPMINFADFISQLKANMTINEEDLNDEP